MRNLVISPAVLEKITAKHSVTPLEVEQCFENRSGPYVLDETEEHQTDPPTLWFIAPTTRNRVLKVIFVFRDGNVFLKSAYDPSKAAVELYDKVS